MNKQPIYRWFEAMIYWTVYSGADQRKHQSSASLAFVRGIHRWPVNSPHKGLVTRKCFHLMTSSWLDGVAKQWAGASTEIDTIEPGLFQAMAMMAEFINAKRARTELSRFNNQYLGCWWCPGSFCSPDINIHDIDYVEYANICHIRGKISTTMCHVSVEEIYKLYMHLYVY